MYSIYALVVDQAVLPLMIAIILYLVEEHRLRDADR